MNILDTISAHTVEDGDHIHYGGVLLESVSVSDNGAEIRLRGYSHNDGDYVTLVCNPDTLIEIWEA